MSFCLFIFFNKKHLWLLIITPNFKRNICWLLKIGVIFIDFSQLGEVYLETQFICCTGFDTSGWCWWTHVYQLYGGNALDTRYGCVRDDCGQVQLIGMWLILHICEIEYPCNPMGLLLLYLLLLFFLNMFEMRVCEKFLEKGVVTMNLLLPC